ncbi:MAG: cytochrome c biogenesis protein [Gemmataceae bacterium]
MNSWIIRGAAALTVAVFGFYLMGNAARKDNANRAGFDLEKLRHVPVVEGGRVKPLDTVARTTLRLHNASEVYEDPADETEQPAIRWLMEVMAFDADTIHSDSDRTGTVWSAKVFKIDNEQLLNLLGLQGRSGLRYALKEFADKFDKVTDEAKKAQAKPKEKRTLYDAKVLEFRTRVEEFLKINQLDVRVLPPVAEGEQWGSILDKKAAWGQEEDMMKAAQEAAVLQVLGRHRLTREKLENMAPDEVADLRREVERQAQRELHTAETRRLATDPQTKPWADLIAAYRDRKVDRFNEIVAQLAKNAELLPARQQKALRLEVFFNHFAPFYDCTGMYVFAAGLALVGLLLHGFGRNAAPPLLWSAFSLAGLAILVHSFGLFARIYIQGRPPVTNLYSSAVWIGWGCVVLCMILERLRPTGIATLVGTTLGFITTIIAHNLGSDGDTMEMMQAVLDTNFWLATHVTIITFGYTATYVAGFLATIFILLGVFTPVLDRPTFKSLSGMIYGVVCFATMLSFVGTVLGGIWADYSWGRFWGWDPKENGALLLVLWNAIVLHARWGGMVKQRGLAILTILGNVVTTWSWFGTNMLGVGLHSYGFSSLRLAAMLGACGFWGSVIVLGLALHPRNWMSFGGKYDAPKEKEPDHEPEMALV